MSFLREQCKEEMPYFLAFAETYLKEGIKEAEYNIEGYSHESSHRPKRDGGGVIIYINNNFSYQKLVSASDEVCSIVGVYINEINLIVFTVYRPPPNYNNQFHGEILEKSFEKIVINNIYKVMRNYTSPAPDIILTGDFNFPKAIWCNGIGRPDTDTSNDKSLQQLIDVSADLSLLQKVNKGTRESRKGNLNILELIFTNNHELISNIYVEPSKITDHKYIVCETSYSSVKEDKSSTPVDLNLSSYNYKKADWVNIKKILNETNWVEILKIYETSEEKLQFILDKVIQIVDDHCAKFKQQRGRNQSKIPRERRILHRKKKKLKLRLGVKHLSSDGRDTIENAIQEIDQELLNSLKNERTKEEERAIENMKTNPKHFFSFARKYIKTKSTVGPFKINDKLITDSETICQKLSEQYSSSFSIPDPSFSIDDSRVFFKPNQEHQCQLNDFCFTKEMIESEIRNIKSDSAAGPDNFPAILLKECARELSEPLYLLWRHSLDNGDIASLLRKAIVCPIYKPNSQRNQPKSYRPVSLTSHIIKTFERVMRTEIVNFLEENNLLPEDQHGFIHGRSTLSQLLHHIEEIIRAWEEEKVTDTIYLDFSKAFDKVDHGILCHKLKQLGISGKVGVWIKEFLSDRTQQITVNGILSNSAPVLSGVPQGSVLGPILFIIMIIDLGRELTYSKSSKYADDTKTTAKISNLTDAMNFQDELNKKVYTWAPTNNMSLNGDKFEHMRVGKNLQKVEYTYSDPSGAPIVEKDHIKDLGVFISNNLSWSKQTQIVVSKARAMVGWALRTFSTREKKCMITIWNSQIRPIIDYCSPLWSPRPWNYKEIDFLEETLRSFTRQINGMKDYDYAQRLKSLKMYSIQRRHERYKIIYAYKIKERKVPNISKNNGLQFSMHGRRGFWCEIPNFPLHHNKAVRARDDSFTLTTCNLWNSLPKHIRSINGESVEYFKKKLDKTLQLYPDIPRCSSNGRFKDKHGRNSNSIVDLYKDSEIKKLVNASDISTGGLPRWPGSN